MRPIRMRRKKTTMSMKMQKKIGLRMFLRPMRKKRRQRNSQKRRTEERSHKSWKMQLLKQRHSSRELRNNEQR